MHLQTSTWPEVETYLKSSSGIVIPIGSTEQHGPNGFIGTDALCPELLARGLSNDYGVMVGPTLAIGMAQHHLGFAGSVTLRPSTMISMIQDVVNSLAKHGFTRFFFLNGHGGNIATLSAAYSELYAQNSLNRSGDNTPDIRCTTTSWFMMPSVSKIANDEFGDNEGSHATCCEISLTYFGYPNHAARVKDAEMAEGRASSGPIFDANDFRRRHPDGRMGSDPRLASIEVGEKLYKATIPEIHERYQAFLTAD